MQTTILTTFMPSEKKLQELGARLATVIETGLVIFLEGPLGAGKTTFVRGFLRGLGYQRKVKSPTYTLVEPYTVNEWTIFHFDLYRLHDARELTEIAIQDYFLPATLCLIEWPEKGVPFLPPPDLTARLALQNVGRDVCLDAQSVRGDKILQRLRCTM